MVMLLRRIIAGQVEEREKALSASCMYPDEDDNDKCFLHILLKALATQMTID